MNGLLGPDDALFPSNGAWRVFEIGLKNCIGQSLALTEIKNLLVMVLRRLDITAAYEEWDCLNSTKKLKLANSERVYQVSGGGGVQYPADRYPCRASICNPEEYKISKST